VAAADDDHIEVRIHGRHRKSGLWGREF
jgi:hypothetical protein